jgi:acyl carrier protein
VRPPLSASYLAPRTQQEEQIARILQELFGIQQIGIHDSFFELGGDSLLGLQLIVRINETMATALSLQDLFDSSTIAGLAEIVQITSLAERTLETRQDLLTAEREEIEI